MKTKKKVLISLLITALFASAMMFGINNFASVSAEVIRPYNPPQQMGVSASYEVNQLNLSTTGGTQGYTYQYWIKTKVSTDISLNLDEEPLNLAYEQFIWQIARAYDDDPAAEISVGAHHIDAQGRYNVIVRVKSGSEVIEEIYRAFAPADIGQPVITGIKVNNTFVKDDYLVVQKGSVNVVVYANLIEDITYSLYYVGSQETPLTNNDGIFSANLNLNDGFHTFRISITGENNAKDEKYIKLYVIDDYLAEERPVITSLTGNSDAEGLTTFVMKVQYADGSSISDDNKNYYRYNLISGNITATEISKVVNAEDKTLDVTFEVDYKNRFDNKNNYGIYYTTGTVSRDSVNGVDDRIIQYYRKHIREVEYFTQLSDADLVGDIYTSETETEVEITLSGSIKNVDPLNLTFAFFREDASGWVMIRDYRTLADAPTLKWTPKRAGTYNIQARMKDNVNGGSYEAAVTKQYLISDTELDGNLIVNILDFETGKSADLLEAGRPYIISANYTKSGDLLYMFTLKTENLGTVYLNKFTTSSKIMFVPSKAERYEITARAISLSSFGYKDISTTVEKQAKIAQKFDLLITDEGMLLWTVSQDLISYDLYVDDIIADSDVSPSYDLTEIITTSGDYQITVKANHINERIYESGTAVYKTGPINKNEIQSFNSTKQTLQYNDDTYQRSVSDFTKDGEPNENSLKITMDKDGENAYPWIRFYGFGEIDSSKLLSISYWVYVESVTDRQGNPVSSFEINSSSGATTRKVLPGISTRLGGTWRDNTTVSPTTITTGEWIQIVHSGWVAGMLDSTVDEIYLRWINCDVSWGAGNTWAQNSGYTYTFYVDDIKANISSDVSISVTDAGVLSWNNTDDAESYDLVIDGVIVESDISSPVNLRSSHISASGDYSVAVMSNYADNSFAKSMPLVYKTGPINQYELQSFDSTKAVYYYNDDTYNRAVTTFVRDSSLSKNSLRITMDKNGANAFPWIRLTGFGTVNTANIASISYWVYVESVFDRNGNSITNFPYTATDHSKVLPGISTRPGGTWRSNTTVSPTTITTGQWIQIVHTGWHAQMWGSTMDEIYLRWINCDATWGIGSTWGNKTGFTYTFYIDDVRININ